MNKTGSRSERAAPVASGGWRSIWHTLGFRLLTLLLVAEAPLVFFTCALALQNAWLRAQDALSQAVAVQHATLDQLDRDLRTAVSLANAAAALPRAVLENQNGCGAVLQLLVAADADRIQAATIEGADLRTVCNSTADRPPASALASLASPAIRAQANNLVADAAGIYVLHPILARDTFLGAILIKLAPLRSVAADARSAVPPPCLWLGRTAAWRPLDCNDAQALPNDNGTRAQWSAPFRVKSQDGRPFLYMAAPLTSDLAAQGTMVLAGSDIRAASTASARWFAFRAAEIAGFFLAEFVLIVAGISVVITSPLKRLNEAVHQWRNGGGFGSDRGASDPRELQQLSASFFEATASLNAREQELRGAILQQDALMKEIHHRVKNNLQIIASLLNLQASRIKAPEARAEFQSARDRVRALATLHRHLYADGELHSINLRAFFAELCGQLFHAIGEAEGDRIKLSVVAPEIRLSSDQAVPIALIVTETVSNAIRHAFPHGRRGTILVQMELEPDQRAVLTVRDDGVGVAARPPQGDTSPTGLGLQLIRGFAKQLGGRLQVSDENGTCYRLEMTLHLHRVDDRPDGAGPERPAA